MSATAVYAVIPEGIDNPARPSGGNRYDRRICDGLTELGWSVRELPVPGRWPHPRRADLDALAATLATALAASRQGHPAIGSGDRPAAGSARDAASVASAGPGAAVEHDVILIDGLIASAAGDLVAEAARAHPVVVLVHMPFGPVDAELRRSEERMLRAASSVVVTSRWTEDFLVDAYGLDRSGMCVIPPAADWARPTPQQPAGGRLLCVAAVTRAKGYDVLLAALADAASRPVLARLPWRCTCVGALDVEPQAARQFQAEVRGAGLADRVHFTGPLTGNAVDAAYGAADLLVLPSRSETWGMVVTEALARGIPVLASDVGGVPEALGVAPDGSRPGILVPPENPRALADSLESWLTDPGARSALRRSALARRATLAPWSHSALLLSAALSTASRKFTAAVPG